jgi:hypothetical protein
MRDKTGYLTKLEEELQEIGGDLNQRIEAHAVELKEFEDDKE